MTTKPSNPFHGVLVAVASPCDEQDVFQENRFSALCESMYDHGAHGLYVCGGTGDGYHMLLSERKRAIEIAVQVSRPHGGTVVDHVGTRNTRDSVALAEHAAQAGADGVSSMPPPLLSFEQLHEFYREIAHAAQLPTIVYHIPMLTGVHLTAEEMIRLLDIDGVIGLKSTEWNLIYNKSILRHRPDIVLYSGMDDVFVPALLYGATGGIGMWYNFFPRAFAAMYQAVRDGNIESAMEVQSRFVDFSLYGWEFGMRAVFEHLSRQRGYGDYMFRRPRAALSGEAREELDRVLPARIEAIDAAVDACLAHAGRAAS